jgi:hypothetical protein
MSWSVYQWVWRLESPLHIGMPPAGVLNRCRLYVPARVMHGAMTAELARAGKNSDFPDYNKMGQETGLNCRFTYMYPAEKVNDNYYAWLPKYQESKGLVWYRQNNENDGRDLNDRNFRNMLLDSRPSTSINPDTDSALDNSLRETECISTLWRETSKKPSAPVYLSGYVFLKENRFYKQLNEMNETVFIGADTRYGLGKIRRVKFDKTDKVFGTEMELVQDHPIITSKIVLGHVPMTDKDANETLRGHKERIGGWDIDKLWEENEVSWVPGSCADKELRWMIDTYGSWVTDAGLIRKSKRQLQREQFGRSSYKLAELVRV